MAAYTEADLVRAKVLDLPEVSTCLAQAALYQLYI